MQVVMPIPDSVKSKDVDFKVGPKRKLKLGVKGQDLVIDDELTKDVINDECSWEIDKVEGKRSVVVTLPKRQQQDQWQYLVKAEDTPADTTITAKVFLDVAIGDQQPDRVII